MATAALDITVPQHLEVAHKIASDKVAAVNARVITLDEQKADAQRQIEKLTAAYNAAVRDFAAGKPADPQAAKTQLELAEMRLAGLNAFHQEASAEALPLIAEQIRTGAAIRDAKNAAEDARLTRALEAREREFNTAQQHLNEAHTAMTGAVIERDSFRDRVAQAQERRRRGQEL